MTEPDVTLTDYGLALLCAWFAWKIARLVPREKNIFQLSWIGFFISISAASFTGGTVHGFFLDDSTVGYKLLWPLTLLFVGATTIALWNIVGFLLSKSEFGRTKWKYFSLLTFFIYTTVVLLYSQSFLVVIVNYLPAVVALFATVLWKFWKTRSRQYLIMAFGIAITFVAAFIQQAGIALHSTYFNHNATYHVVQALGLLFLYLGLVRLPESERPNR